LRAYQIYRITASAVSGQGVNESISGSPSESESNGYPLPTTLEWVCVDVGQELVVGDCCVSEAKLRHFVDQNDVEDGAIQTVGELDDIIHTYEAGIVIVVMVVGCDVGAQCRTQQLVKVRRSGSLL
jgi:hypothetical protein